eukprot:gene14208-biopygen17126
MQAHPLRRVLRGPERAAHINLKEVAGLQEAVAALGALLQKGILQRPPHPIRLYGRVDNTTLLYGFRSGSSSSAVQQALGKLCLSTLRAGMQITELQDVPSALHAAADGWARLEGEEGWVLTQRAMSVFLQWLKDRNMPLPTVDALCSSGVPLLDRYCSRWADPRAEFLDFFSQAFDGEILFINAPFRLLRRVLRHLVGIGAQGYIMVPTHRSHPLQKIRG